MFRKFAVLAAVVSVLALLAPLSTAADAVLPAPVKAVWDLAKAARETTPTSERISVNGLWRWQPAADQLGEVPADNWGYFKVPGHWPGINTWLQMDSQKLYFNNSWATKSPSSCVAAWYQREITVPADWKGRRVSLSMDVLNSYAAVFLDGAKVGEAYFPAGEVDLTPAVKPGVKQTLSIYVKASPLGAVVMAFTDTGVPKEVKGSVERKGLCGDLWLVSSPKGPRVSDLRVDPSTRNWTVTFSAELPDLAPNAKYTLKASLSDAGKPVTSFASDAFSAADLKDGRFSFTAKWHPDKLWDLVTPQNQYTVSLVLSDAAGKALDAFRPVRFGFREFYVQGRDFYLNGSRVYLSIVAMDNAQYGAAWASYDAAKETFLRNKTFGINCFYSHNYGCAPGSHDSYEEVFRAADDAGVLLAFALPHSGNYDWKDAKTPETYARHTAAYVRYAESHPSVVLYAMSHNSTSYAQRENPDLVDGLHNNVGQVGERTDEPGLNALKAQAIAERLDPSRVVYHQAAGNLGHAYSINVYCNWAPVQEVSDWFTHWSTAGVKPLVLTEFDTPYDTDWTMFRGWYGGARNWGNKPMGWEYCPAEWNASLLGDRAFDMPEQDKVNVRIEADKWRTSDGWMRWDYKPYELVGRSTVGNDLKQEVRSLYLTDNWRSFRLLGVSCVNEFVPMSFWAPKPGLPRKSASDLPVDWETIQRPGFSPDFTVGLDRFDLAFKRDDWTPGPAAKALIRNNMPLLAFIAGPKDRLTSKDHNFLPGETFEKNLVLINNSRLPVDCDFSWFLAPPVSITPVTGPAVSSKKVTVPTGEQSHNPVKLTIPADAKPGAYTLSLTAKMSNGETQTDSLVINVVAPVPVRDISAFPKPVALFDPKGDTAKLLQSLNVSFTPVKADADLKNFDVLIVGRQALTIKDPAPDISRVRDGLRVVIFEQDTPVLEKRFGFRVTDYGLRTAFPRVPDHPLLAGLSEGNLHDWRGSSTLYGDRLPSTLSFGANGEVTLLWCDLPVKRTYRCGNTGSIASVLIEKPAKGDFLPLVDCGYALQYSPLMLYREGSGCVVLCQFDVTGRTDQDPAASRLVSNILSFVSSYKRVDPVRSVVYAGDPAGKSFLERAGLAVADFPGAKLDPAKVVLVAGPGSADVFAKDDGGVKKFTEAGGKVFAVASTPAEFKLNHVETAKAEHISTVFPVQPQASLLAGVGCADTMNHDPRPFDLITDATLNPLGDGVLAAPLHASVVFSQLAPWQYDYEKKNKSLPAYNLKRTFRCTTRLTLRVLSNMGVSSPTPFLSRFSKPDDTKTPWIDSFYLDKPQEMDDPYRFFRW